MTGTGNGNNGAFGEMINNLALRIGAVLPGSVSDLGQVWAHRGGTDDRADMATPRTWLRIGVGSATTAHLTSAHLALSIL